MTFELQPTGLANPGRRSWKERIPPRLRLAQRAWRSWLDGEAELHLIPRLCDPGRWSLDVGANNGVYSWHMARASAGVTAFEPQPRHARFLAAALGPDVAVEQVALSDAGGDVRLRVPRRHMEDGRATIEPGNALTGFDWYEITVPRRRLGDYPLPPVGMIKIDVEGHELAVVNGAAALLARDRPNLLIEAEERHRPNAVPTLCARLSGWEYRPFVLAGTAGPADGPPNNFVFLHDSRAEAVLAHCPRLRPWG